MVDQNTVKKYYFGRVAKNVMIAICLLLFSLAVGIIGYRVFFHTSWVDSLINASMILTGMGPVDKATTDAAKVFASIYAIYSGVAFLSSVTFLVGPLLHRFLYRLHLNVTPTDEDNECPIHKQCTCPKKQQ
jgi:hypothetical protein